MKGLYVVVIAAVVLTLRFSLPRLLKKRRSHETDVEDPKPRRSEPRSERRRGVQLVRAFDRLGLVGTIASREIRERVSGKLFRFGTLVILLAVAAAIIIPTFDHGSGLTKQTVGVVGRLPSGTRQVVQAAATANKDAVQLIAEPSLEAAKADLRSGKLDMAIVGGDRVFVNEPLASNSSPADSSLVDDIAEYLGVLKAYQAAGLTSPQASEVARAHAVPVSSLQKGSKGTSNGTSVVGIVLLFVMLTQYNTWILIGVMQEKSSRVVEVLLAAVRPIQLLGGKVLGIGLVALGQATLIVGFALVLAKAVGSDLLHGSTPLALLAELLWLVLGYAFYCWVYAAAGSTAERQDQVQTLALPISIPILVAYIFALTAASSGSASVLFKVLAYLPPTSPFCMPVLVGLGLATWWEFTLSIVISIAGTAGVAVLAAGIYRRAVLQTGGRVRLRELVARGSHS